MEKITVFGSFVVDLMARADHLPVAGETVKSSMFKLGPGGKGFNQGVAANKAGANIKLVTKLGRDSFADVALDKLKEENMDTDYIFFSDEEPTGTALIMVDENTSENQIMVTLGACSTFNQSDIDKIEPIIKDSKFLLTQLETNVDAIEKVIKIASDNNVSVVLDPAPIQEIKDDLLKMIEIITPNEVEAAILTGVKIKNMEDAKKAAKILLERGVEKVVITLGAQGVLVYTDEKYEVIENFKVDVLDTSGAGDAFNGCFITALSEGEDIFKAAKFGRSLANLSVTKLGTSVAMPTRKEVDDFIKLNEFNKA